MGAIWFNCIGAAWFLPFTPSAHTETAWRASSALVIRCPGISCGQPGESPQPIHEGPVDEAVGHASLRRKESEVLKKAMVAAAAAHTEETES